ncbi:GATA transcription factor 1-like [Rutidosis leptorrhynchoides]|uniref:GATA transcription factor 1-like n=1 Tax=Rutidosis leptorrhynchoides TaxID=125765 RepID=UPI003A99565A
MDSVACFMDDLLLDFASDIDDDEDNCREKPCSLPYIRIRFSASFSLRLHGEFFGTGKPDSLGRLGVNSDLEFAEEELEWLSNKDAFPSVDEILLQHPNNELSKQQSPVSVLETITSPTSTTTTTTGSATSLITSCCVGLPAPVRKRRSRRRRCENHEPWWRSKELIILKSVTPTANKKSCRVIGGRKCLHCGSQETPQWRAGPMGPKTLCNACGVRFKSGRLVPEYRPASSPTFSNKLHSNSHRKVVEMRKKKEMMGLLLANPISLDKG